MRPVLAAISLLSLLAMTAVASSRAFAQAPGARRYPDLLELMQDRTTATSPAAALNARPDLVPPYPAATSATSAPPSQGSRPIIPLPVPAGSVTTPPPAPPASPLPAPGPSDFSAAGPRKVVSAEHQIVVREYIPGAPPAAPALLPGSGWQPASYEISAEPPIFASATEPTPSQFAPTPPPPEENYIAPPMGSQSIPPATLAPVPEPRSASSQFAEQTMPAPSFDQPFSREYADGSYIEGDAGMGDYQGVDFDYGFTEGPVEGRAFRNFFPIEEFLEPDPCGTFLPFGTLGTKIGNERVISGGGFFVPLWQALDSMIFTDLRGTVDDHDSGDGYIGLGYRTYLDPNWIFGTYIYADIIATNQRNLFGQGQLGVELMSLNWEVRANGYAPGTASQSAIAESGISNGTAITRDFRERAYSGFDVEVGHRFLNWGWNDKYEVRWFLGGYGFGQGSGSFPSFGGPRGRLEMRIHDLPWCGPQSRVEFGAEYSYDRIRNEQIFGYLRVRIPFGGKSGRSVLDPLRRRMLDNPVHRVD